MNIDLVFHNIIPPIVEQSPSIPESFIFVDSLSDLPTPNESNVITLEDNKTYYITTEVDLFGNRLIAGANTTILGSSSENCILKSTGLSGLPLITSAWSLPMRNLSFDCDIVIALDATGHTNQAIDWSGVNFLNCQVGTIKNYSNVILSDCAFLNCSNITLDGTIGTVSFFQCIFDNSENGTMINTLSSLIILRRIRFLYCAFVTLVGETSLNINTNTQIPVESYILDTVNFSGGGTYTSGVVYTDNKSKFINCNGIINSTNMGAMSWSENATVTTISQKDIPTKILGTSIVNSNNQKFSHSNNRLTCTGSITRLYLITGTVSLTSGNNQLLGIQISKNGNIIDYSESHVTTSGNGRSENVKIQVITPIALSEYIELFCANYTTSDDITVTDMNLIISVLN